jgi:hypothetical protein
VSRRIITIHEFHDSLAALDDTPEIAAVVSALVLRATRQPEHAPMLPGTKIRSIRSRTYGNYPALRLFYSLEDDAVRILHVERYDELA